MGNRLGFYPRAENRAVSGAAMAAASNPPGGTLHVVATPIGNLGDLSPRALETLKAVSMPCSSR